MLRCAIALCEQQQRPTVCGVHKEVRIQPHIENDLLTKDSHQIVRWQHQFSPAFRQVAGLRVGTVELMHSTIPHIALSITRIVEYDRTVHGRTPATSWNNDGPEITTFSTTAARASALVHTLHGEFGIDGDQRIATLMYNYAEHFEVFLSVASMGTVFQPLNKQLMPDQIVHVINHASDQVIIADPTEIRLLAEVLPHCPHVRAVTTIGIGDLPDMTEQLPDSIPWYSYESLVDGRPNRFDWPELDKNSGAAICYSMDTGDAPKGVVYSHRSLCLHDLNMRTTNSFAISHGNP